VKRAIITGITGQDGSYLAELLLDKGYEVHGIVRRTSSIQRGRLEHLYTNSRVYNRTLFFHYSDLGDHTSLRRIFNICKPDEIYHLAGQSHVGLSFEIPELTATEVGFSLLGILEIIRDLQNPPKLFHASSSEIFGMPEVIPQAESTPFSPVSPYGASKAFATNMVKIYRESYGMFCVNGIMFNHESPRRGENFVTKKICRSAALIAEGLQRDLVMGDTKVSRDWGHAKDFVEGMWLSLQYKKPEDYIFASGVSNSLEKILELSFSKVGLNWKEFYKKDQRYMRPCESKCLIGDATKAKELLNWSPTYSLETIVEEMMKYEIQQAKQLNRE
jgi:GDPmannose 4,6-dehydratase